MPTDNGRNKIPNTSTNLKTVCDPNKNYNQIKIIQKTFDSLLFGAQTIFSEKDKSVLEGNS